MKKKILNLLLSLAVLSVLVVVPVSAAQPSSEQQIQPFGAMYTYLAYYQTIQVYNEKPYDTGHYYKDVSIPNGKQIELTAWTERKNVHAGGVIYTYDRTHYFTD